MSLSNETLQLTSTFSRNDWTPTQETILASLEAEYAATHSVLFGEDPTGPFAEIVCKLGQRNVTAIVSKRGARVESYRWRGLWPFRKLRAISDYLRRVDFNSESDFAAGVLARVKEHARYAQRMSPDRHVVHELDKNKPKRTKVTVNLEFEPETLETIRADGRKRNEPHVQVWLANARSPEGFIGLVGEFASDEDLKWIDEGVWFELDGIKFHYGTGNPQDFVDCVAGTSIKYPRTGMVQILCQREPRVFSDEIQRQIDDANARRART